MRQLIKPVVRSNFKPAIFNGISKAIEYVAQLDGATQFWPLSAPINPDITDDFELNLSFQRSTGLSLGGFIFCSMNGNSYGLNMYASGDW